MVPASVIKMGKSRNSSPDYQAALEESRLIPAHIFELFYPENGWYTIKCSHYAHVITASSEKHYISHLRTNGSDTQLFYLHKLDNDCYAVKNKKSGKYWDIIDGLHDNHKELTQNKWSSGKSQQFSFYIHRKYSDWKHKINKIPYRAILIQPRHSKKVLYACPVFEGTTDIVQNRFNNLESNYYQSDDMLFSLKKVY